MLLYQRWTRSSSNITLRRVHLRGFPVNIVLPRYRDRSSSANTTWYVGTLPRSCFRPHNVDKSCPSVKLSEVCTIRKAGPTSHFNPIFASMSSPHKHRIPKQEHVRDSRCKGYTQGFASWHAFVDLLGKTQEKPNAHKRG